MTNRFLYNNILLNLFFSFKSSFETSLAPSIRTIGRENNNRPNSLDLEKLGFLPKHGYVASTPSKDLVNNISYQNSGGNGGFFQSPTNEWNVTPSELGQLTGKSK